LNVIFRSARNVHITVSLSRIWLTWVTFIGKLLGNRSVDYASSPNLYGRSVRHFCLRGQTICGTLKDAPTVHSTNVISVGEVNHAV
jgi:hypothetical protein